MKSRNFFLLNSTAAVLFLFITSSLTLAQEKVIQKEKIEFSKCLKVITTSENKLSISPVIKNISTKRVAVLI